MDKQETRMTTFSLKDKYNNTVAHVRLNMATTYVVFKDRIFASESGVANSYKEESGKTVCVIDSNKIPIFE